MRFNIITLFPDFCKALNNYSVIGRAIRNKTIGVKITDLRSFGLGKHKEVDSKPFGGGVGMLLRVDVVGAALDSIEKQNKSKVVLLSPKGKQFTQKMAVELAKLDEIVLVCGHYEGFDERITNLVDEVVSIGPYVLSGGEIPAMAMIDTIARQIPKVLGKTESKDVETFSIVENKKIIEYPQYTRPREFRGQKVPDTLISGNHSQIEAWKKSNTHKVT
jgi:tRNA (guanine37-N1)-methyltransferase